MLSMSKINVFVLAIGLFAAGQAHPMFEKDVVAAQQKAHVQEKYAQKKLQRILDDVKTQDPSYTSFIDSLSTIKGMVTGATFGYVECGVFALLTGLCDQVKPANWWDIFLPVKTNWDKAVDVAYCFHSNALEGVAVGAVVGLLLACGTYAIVKPINSFRGFLYRRKLYKKALMRFITAWPTYKRNVSPGLQEQFDGLHKQYLENDYSFTSMSEEQAQSIIESALDACA